MLLKLLPASVNALFLSALPGCSGLAGVSEITCTDDIVLPTREGCGGGVGLWVPGSSHAF